MAVDSERKPLLSGRLCDDSTSENERLEPGIISETEAARMFLLTTRGSSARAFHRRNL